VGDGGLVLGLPGLAAQRPPGTERGTDVSEPVEEPEAWHPCRELSSDSLWSFLSHTCPQAARLPTKLHAENTLLHPDSVRAFPSFFLKFQALETGTFHP